ncbi:hypothetical protein SopranoGao_74 [Klebsiella phage SopranoGao]|uniref:Uncharacterized protein n=1 Tax=Klebsiella phage SopranoGao TaxID=2026944 RepID=A0A248SKY5_9CAUD|nr:hypothetical protein KMC54_gp74 [Klebsiella phage SopranoGao]ASV45097.1 hypothetical protein SopranoGao_74 [Klebsiella phage SopranoGao]
MSKRDIKAKRWARRQPPEPYDGVTIWFHEQIRIMGDGRRQFRDRLAGIRVERQPWSEWRDC